MGVDLKRRGGDLHLTWSAWRYCLDVARAFGWQPEGTKPTEWFFDPNDWPPSPDDLAEAAAKWKGGYFTNDFQRVTDTDAQALAAALDRSIVAVQTERVRDVHQMKALAGSNDDPDATADDPMARLAKLLGVTVPSFAFDLILLKTLADYARQGDFLIG